MKKVLILFSFFLLANVGCTVSDPEMMELLQEIKAQNDKLLQEVEAMKGTLALLDGKYQVILASLVDNKKELEALKSQIDALKAQIAQQLIKIDQLSAQLTQQGADLVKLSQEIKELKASCEELKDKIEELLQGRSPVPTNGLVAWYPFNGNASDESGNGNNGIVNGAILTTDRLNQTGSAYTFDGVDDFISTQRNDLNNFTISFWYVINKSQELSPLVDAHNGNFEILANFLKPTFVKWVSLPSNYTFLSLENPNEINKWYNLVCTYSSNKVQIYLNGSLVKTFENVVFPRSNGNFFFGKSQSGTSQFLSGKMDDIAIWNRVLTADEISKIYKGEKF
jgi:cell division protein FtsB